LPPKDAGHMTNTWQEMHEMLYFPISFSVKIS